MHLDEVMDAPIHTHLLPPALRDLIECLGEAGAFRLIKHRGGAWICVPKKVSPDHPLCEILTPAEFASLVHMHRGSTIVLPKYDSIARQLRYRTVLRMRQQGAQADEIALKTGYTVRRVWQILREHGIQRAAPPSRSLNLF